MSIDVVEVVIWRESSVSGGSCAVQLFFFFFSSRRRHTRCLSDWSSDVCSSDLPVAAAARLLCPLHGAPHGGGARAARRPGGRRHALGGGRSRRRPRRRGGRGEIGRAHV